MSALLTGIVMVVVALIRYWSFLFHDTCDTGIPVDAVQFKVVDSSFFSNSLSATTITSGDTKN